MVSLYVWRLQLSCDGPNRRREQRRLYDFHGYFRVFLLLLYGANHYFGFRRDLCQLLPGYGNPDLFSNDHLDSHGDLEPELYPDADFDGYLYTQLDPNPQRDRYAVPKSDHDGQRNAFGDFDFNPHGHFDAAGYRYADFHLDGQFDALSNLDAKPYRDGYPNRDNDQRPITHGDFHRNCN